MEGDIDGYLASTVTYMPMGLFGKLQKGIINNLTLTAHF